MSDLPPDQPPLALAATVPRVLLLRLVPRVGGGSACFV